jgi:NAD(P)-dependent dehydrogenase (short-subunit alcohol dehydrogenase family)
MIGSAVGECVLTLGIVPYSTTKGAVKIFTQGLSREVASRGITSWFTLCTGSRISRRWHPLPQGTRRGDPGRLGNS